MEPDKTHGRGFIYALRDALDDYYGKKNDKLMNILFVSMYQVSEQKGGTERTTARLSNELRKRGHRCYNLYKKSIDSSFEITDFDGIYSQCSAIAIADILDKHSIDKIIIEGAFVLVENTYKGRLLSKQNHLYILSTTLLQVMNHISMHFIH